jgi:hypothetical protein
MNCINVTDVQVLNNPATFTTPLQFEITFECVSPIKEGTFVTVSPSPPDLQWSLCYVGAADSTAHDQMLETIELGPINVGLSRFIFQVCSDSFWSYCRLTLPTTKRYQTVKYLVSLFFSYLVPTKGRNLFVLGAFSYLLLLKNCSATT